MLHFSLCSSSQEGGSYQQRILTEYLKGIQSRAEEIVQVLQSWAHKGTKVCSNIYRNNAFPQCYLHQISIWTLFTMCLCGFALLGLANFSSFPLQSPHPKKNWLYAVYIPYFWQDRRHELWRFRTSLHCLHHSSDQNWYMLNFFNILYREKYTNNLLVLLVNSSSL